MFYFYIPFSLTLMLYGYIFITNILHMYQLQGYKVKNTLLLYFKKSKVGDHFLYFTSMFLFYFIYLIVNNFIFRVIWISLFNIAFFVYIINFLYLDEKQVAKIPLKYTKRIIRFICVYFILNIGAYVGLAFLLNKAIDFNALFYLFPVISYVMFFIAHFITVPIEKCIFLFYLNKSKAKLNKRGDLIKIAITGSFGKTSTKFILSSILSEKFSVLTTPNSYNTPMGISKTILADLNNNTQVFIMEMGANKVGDIKYLCKAFKPQIGVLTSIGNCHLETFKTPQNIINTKCELPQNLYNPQLMVFNCEDKNIFLYSKHYNKNKILIGDDFDLSAKNIKTDENGCEFDIYYKQKYFITAKTCLIGKHNVGNILLCVGVAIHFGLSKQQIITGIRKIQPIKNRLELIKNANGVTILNDSYNSNIQGCKTALSALDCFKGKNKIVITPGMVELGDAQYKENFRFGKMIARVANSVIIVNKTNKEAIMNGLFDSNFDFNNVKAVSSFSNIDFSKFKKEDVILIENDLPDSYN